MSEQPAPKLRELVLSVIADASDGLLVREIVDTVRCDVPPGEKAALVRSVLRSLKRERLVERVDRGWPPKWRSLAGPEVLKGVPPHA